MKNKTRYSKDMFRAVSNEDVILITCVDCGETINDPSDPDMIECLNCGSEDLLRETNMEGATCIFCGIEAGPYEDVYTLKKDGGSHFDKACCAYCYDELEEVEDDIEVDEDLD